MGDGDGGFAFLWVLVPLAGVIGWIITSVVRSKANANDQVAAALTQSAETNRLLAERIEQLDRRLAAVEKTLNDVG